MDPDLAGFSEAQQRLRSAFGEPVVFLAPVESVWPDGTPVDPETNRPYDPVLAATSSGQASALVNATVAVRPYGKPEAEWTALGATERDHVMLISDIAAASACEGAESFVVRDESYKVTAMRPDGIGGVQRWLTFGRKR